MTRSMPAARAAAANRRPTVFGEERYELVVRRRARGGPQDPDRAADDALHEAHVPHLALRVLSCGGGR